MNQGEGRRKFPVLVSSIALDVCVPVRVWDYFIRRNFPMLVCLFACMLYNLKLY